MQDFSETQQCGWFKGVLPKLWGASFATGAAASKKLEKRLFLLCVSFTHKSFIFIFDTGTPLTVLLFMTVDIYLS